MKILDGLDLGNNQILFGSAISAGLIKTKSFAPNIASIAVSYFIGLNDHTINCGNGTSTITVTLPLASTCVGSIFIIKRYPGTTHTGTINIAVTGSNLLETITGTLAASTTVAAYGANGSRLMYQSDGNTFHLLTGV